MTKILIVDDSNSQRKYLENILKILGFKVISVENAESAMAIIKSDKLEMILLDVILPGISGWQMCRKLKSDSQFKTIPIIICSTKSTVVDREWTKMIGANAHLNKPISANQLIQTITKITKIPRNYFGENS
ncbi:MAG: PleD family two-component system response regulator [Prochloraceae cyanobacterium]